MDNANQAEAITKERFESFMFALKVFLAQAKEAKKRGDNDYNPLKAVQKIDNEVNMHSGFLHSLLDTNGEHYQDDLFLSLFLDTLSLKKWFGDTKNAQVLKEHKHIDIYITNDENHIIIENKICADDQPKQIAKYIESIHDENSNESVSYENIAVVYLTPFPRKPEKNSLGEWDKSYLFDEKGNQIKFEKIIKEQFDEKAKIYFLDEEKTLRYQNPTYKKDILEWIKKCQSKSGVGNITSLNSALEFYKDIVQIITKQKENKMNIVDFLKQDKSLVYFDIAQEIINKKEQITQEYNKAYFSKTFDKESKNLKNEVENHQEKYKDWKILLEEKECERFCSKPDTDWWKNIVVYNEKYEESKQTFRFMFEAEQGVCFGVRLNIRKDNNNINFVDKYYSGKKVKELHDNFLRKEFPNIKFDNYGWFEGWLGSKKIGSFKDYFLDNYQKVNEINEWLKEQEKDKNSDIAKLAKEIKDYKIES
ncbi:PDDEXK-like family protein [Helicobacter sp. T3_23-1056]